MSVSEAKEILGLKGKPTPEEITKAYKQMAIKHHPDRGGDLAKMVEVNVARDVLLPPPDRELDAPSKKPNDPPGGWRSQDRVPKQDPVEIGTPFSTAVQGLPSGVEWLIVSDQWSLGGLPSSFANSLLVDPQGKGRTGIIQYVYGFLAVGEREGQIVGALLECTSPNTMALLRLTEWAFSDFQVAPLAAWLKSPDKVVKKLLSSLKPKLANSLDVRSRMGFHYLDRKTSLTEKDVSLSVKGTSLSAMAELLSPSVTGQPLKMPVVEMISTRSAEKIDAWMAIPKDIRPSIAGDEEHRFFDADLAINGRKYRLGQETLNKIPRLLAWAIWGTPQEQRRSNHSKRTLSKLAKWPLSYILTELLKCMDAEPAAFKAHVEQTLQTAEAIEATLPARRRW